MSEMTAVEFMQRADELFSHVWMVRTFLKHSEEAEEDDELCEVHRELYDVMHALGPSLANNDAETYLKQVKKKIRKLEKATEFFEEIQPEISGHMNFQMAAKSLATSSSEIRKLLDAYLET